MRTLISSLLALVLIALLSPSGPAALAYAPPPPAAQVDVDPFGYRLEVVGQIGGSTLDAAVQGDYAYIGAGPRLLVVDISTPAAPTLVGQTDLMEQIVQGVAVSGTYAYVADHYAGLRIIDMLDFHRTGGGRVLRHDVGGGCDGGGQLCLCGGPFERPARYRHLNSRRAHGGRSLRSTRARAEVAIEGNLAYVASWDAGMRIIDISNPSALSEAGSIETPGKAYDVAVSGDYAYVADYTGGLRIIDISDTGALTETGFYDTYDVARGVSLVGSSAFVSDGTSGLRIIDVPSQSHPQRPASTTHRAKRAPRRSTETLHTLPTTTTVWRSSISRTRQIPRSLPSTGRRATERMWRCVATTPTSPPGEAGYA